VTEGSNGSRTTRRSVLKLAGAAALGAAGTAALGARSALAAGSGNTIDLFTPTRIADTRGGAPLAAGAEMVLGPFPVPGFPAFTSDSYDGIIANLTAVQWTGRGWLSIRQNGTAFHPASIVVNFSGPSASLSNLFIRKFGFPIDGTHASDGKIIIRNGPAPTNFVIDLVGYLGPDQ
jgi:hypothetical protein